MTLAINHVRQFTASFTSALNDECEGKGSREQRWPLSQVVVLARRGKFYLEPLKASPQ